MKKKKKSTTA